MTWFCLKPMLALVSVVMLPGDQGTDMNGVQLEGQTCVSGIGAYANATSSELYAGGIQYGLAMKATEDWSVIAQPYLGASYTSKWVPELPNGYQFDTGIRLLVKWKRLIGYMGWQHDSNAGLGQEVQKGRWRYGNAGLNLLKFGAGWEF